MFEFETEACKKVFAEMKEAQDVWKYFLLCVETPRPSTQMELISERVCGWAKALGLEYEKDEFFNVVIRKPAFKGLENKPMVCLQAHLDIVYTKNNNVQHDKDKPIVPRIVGEYLKASGTSLGADNGIGIGLAFAILADKELKHGPLEVLLTSDEEIAGFLKSKYLINVDSEEENSVCVGCAGGVQTNITIPLKRAAAAGTVNVKFAMSQFRGGHTGVDIAENRGNPIKLVARLLKATESEFNPLAVEIVGGTTHNAIPRELDFEVAVKKEQEAAFIAAIQEEWGKIEHEFKIIETLGIKLDKVAADSKLAPMDAESSKKVINFLNLIPFGVLRMSPAAKGLVETSYAVTIVKTNENDCFVMGSGRSSSKSQIDYLEGQVKSLCHTIGIDGYERVNAYPGWEPVWDSHLLKTATEVHEKELGRRPDVYAIHAGLECGLILDNYPEMEAISIGPELHNPHSPDEELLITSVPRSYKFLAKTLEQLVA